MSITDELREYVIDADGMGMTHGHAKCIYAIADHIDVAHRSALEKLAAQMDESEDGWVRLPVDADGVPIRVGDAMVLQHEVSEKPYVVQSITWDGEDWYFTCDEGFFNACGWAHHHAPTVEDVLREFADRVCNSGHQWGLDAADTIAEFAAKLRLAGDE